MKIFLDNNASTQVSQSVVNAMKRFFTDVVAPPGSDYGISAGVKAKEALDEAREVIASKLNVKPEEIIFTSGQVESNNLVIKGIAFRNLKSENKYLIASSISHMSILDSLKALEKHFGFKYDLIKVDSEGFLDRDHLKELLGKKPLLVSVPHGNVEIGTVDDVNEIANICHEFEVPIHVEATYSFCKVPLDASKLDFVTVTSHLIHGPKGSGALKVNRKIKLVKQIDGGLQEFGYRGGTENLPAIVGFATAVKEYTQELVDKERELRDYLWELAKEKLSEYQITGPKDRSKRLPNHFSIVCNFVEGESILLHLDMLGYMIATGSACSSKRLQASHVLTAIGLPTEVSHGSVRVGVSYFNTKEEIEGFLDNLATVVDRLRAMSPVDSEFMDEYFKMKAEGKVEEEEDHHHHEIEEDD
ncbi:MAG: cysteine desulfurase family protein [Candidatus Hodarchaeales archaeon]